jgi:hypothetical protein
MAQEDHAQHRHEVIAGGELRIGAQVICGFPQVGFQLLDVIGEANHNSRTSLKFLPSAGRMK